MALDTRGIADGFMKGFSFMDNYLDKEADRGRRDKMDMQQQEDRDYNRERQEALDAERQEDRTYVRERNEKLDARQEAQLSRANDRADRTEGRQQSEFDQKQFERNATEVMATVQAGGTLTDQQRQFIEKNPQVNPWRFLDDNTQSAISYFEKAVESAEIDSDDDFIRFANAPQTVDAFNQLFKNQVQKGDGGKKRIKNILPGPQEGTLVFNLEIQGEDGKVREEPMTVDRGVAGKDDKIKVVSIEDVTQQIAGMSIFNKSLRELPEEARNKFIDYGMELGYTKKGGTNEVAKWVEGAEGSKKKVYGLNKKGDVISTSDTGDLTAGNTAKYTWGPLKDASLDVTPKGESEQVNVTGVQTHHNGAVRGYTNDGAVLELINNEWVRPSSAAPTPAADPAQPGNDSKLDSAFQTLRNNPANKKYTDEQLRQALQQKLGGASQ